MLSLSHADELRLAVKMCEMVGNLHSAHVYKEKNLQMLYAVFLLDLQDVQGKTITERQVPQRIEDIFIGFIRLLSLHFAEHHDIVFYGSQLNISVVYFSRVVSQVAGRTVIDYINQIASRLHFADTPSFSKFSLRMKCQSPRAYRNAE